MTVFTLDQVLPIRENLIRLTFAYAPYFSGIYDDFDAAPIARYTTAIVAGTVGLDGFDVRPVSVSRAKQTPAEDLPDGGVFGRSIDLSLDRAMSPTPAQYTLIVNGLKTFDVGGPGGTLLDVPSATKVFFGLFRVVQAPLIDPTQHSRDIANPQDSGALQGSSIAFTSTNGVAPVAGTFAVDEQGDYAFDAGIVGLKKRILRRLTTSKGRFAHAPSYGVGIPQLGKRLASASVLQEVLDEAEKQISEEPDVAAVRVRAIVSQSTPGLVRFRVLVRSISGASSSFDAPFTTG